jgi:hypothetical protein
MLWHETHSEKASSAELGTYAEIAIAVPMDGFHLYRWQLDAMEVAQLNLSCPAPDFWGFRLWLNCILFIFLEVIFLLVLIGNFRKVMWSNLNGERWATYFKGIHHDQTIRQHLISWPYHRKAGMHI